MGFIIVLAFGFIAFYYGKKNGLFDSKSTSIDSLPGEEVQTTIKKDKIQAAIGSEGELSSAGLNILYVVYSQVVVILIMMGMGIATFSLHKEFAEYILSFGLTAVFICSVISLFCLHNAGKALMRADK